MILSVNNLSKVYMVDVVFSDVTFSVGEGECYCLIGKNGSGKSTLINILTNLIGYNSGSIAIFGKSYADDAHYIKERIGVLPEFNPVIAEFSTKEYLEYVGYLYNLEKEVIYKRIDTLVDFFFEDYSIMDKPVEHFSKGMKLKLGLCAALIHKPKLLLLDEPFDGLDVISSNKLSSFLNSYRKQGNAIFLSSHNMLYLEKVATHIGVLNSGKLPLSKSLVEITNGEENSLEEKIIQVLGYQSEDIVEF